MLAIYLNTSITYCCSNVAHCCSSGCCYNDQQYNWGDEVDTFSGIKLVCGAKLYKTEPFFVAAIVPVLQDSDKGKEDVFVTCVCLCV